MSAAEAKGHAPPSALLTLAPPPALLTLAPPPALQARYRYRASLIFEVGDPATCDYDLGAGFTECEFVASVVEDHLPESERLAAINTAVIGVLLEAVPTASSPRAPVRLATLEEDVEARRRLGPHGGQFRFGDETADSRYWRGFRDGTYRAVANSDDIMPQLLEGGTQRRERDAWILSQAAAWLRRGHSVAELSERAVAVAAAGFNATTFAD